jgi:hypothetical protein
LFFFAWARHRDSQCLLGAAMAWVYLIAAGLFEVGWPIGLKWARTRANSSSAWSWRSAA